MTSRFSTLTSTPIELFAIFICAMSATYRRTRGLTVSIFVFGLILAGSVTAAPATAGGGCANVSIPTNLTALRNTSVAVPIDVDDVTGLGAVSFDFTLTYDPAVISTPTVNTTGTMSDGWTITINPNTPGTLIVSGFSTAPLTGSGTVIKFNFNAIGPIGSSTALNLTSFMFNEDTPCSDESNGLLTIISGTVSGAVTYANAAGPPSGPPLPVPVPNTTLSGTGLVNVSTSTDSNGLYSLSGFGAGAYTVTPSKTGNVNGITAFDSGLIAQHVVNLITLSANQLTAADVSQSNTVTSFDAALIAQWVVLIPNISNTGTWKFVPANRLYTDVETNFSSQNYSAILMGEVSGNWNPAAADQLLDAPDTPKDEGVGGIPVTAPTVYTSNGANFNIAIAVADTTGQSIISYQYDLLYDSTKITPQAGPCDLTGTISAGLIATCNPISPGVLKVAVFGATPLTGSGTLMKLKFTAIGTAGSSSPLTLQTFMFNEGVPQSTVTNGVAYITGPTASEVSLSGRISDQFGYGVPNASVVITDTTGATRSYRANSFGNYIFSGLRAGETYTVSVSARGLQFSPRLISLSDSVSGFDIVAEP